MIVNNDEKYFLNGHACEKINRTRSIKGPCTAFGVVLNDKAIINDRKIVSPNEYFCIGVSEGEELLITTWPTTIVALFTVRNYVRKNNVLAGTWNELRGDQLYIDGCTDTLLICPSKLGDPCLNALYVEPNTTQTEHTHPSLRFGVIVAGAGSMFKEGVEYSLLPGTVWVIEPNTKHYFKTADKMLTTIAYHPDSDWGPTDQVHPMLNKTNII